MQRSRYDLGFAIRTATDMRAKADAAQGAEREYFLWLATEWEQTAARFNEPSRSGHTAGDH